MQILSPLCERKDQGGIDSKDPILPFPLLSKGGVRYQTTLIVIILFGIVVIAFLVNYKFAFLNFFFLPVILAGYYLGKRQAVLAASLCVLLVAFYHIFSRVLSLSLPQMSLDEVLNIVTWAGFLILTAAVMGMIAEQREARMKSLQGAYSGGLETMLKHLKVGGAR